MNNTTDPGQPAPGRRTDAGTSDAHKTTDDGQPEAIKTTNDGKRSDPLTLLSAALEQAGAIIVGIRDDQQHLPTPCASWDVAELVAHVVKDLAQFTERASGGSPDWSAPTKDLEGDYIDAYRAGATRLIGAWLAAGDLSGTVMMPGMGELPRRFPVDQQIAEFAVHAWDLAVATVSRPILIPTSPRPHWTGDGRRCSRSTAAAGGRQGLRRRGRPPRRGTSL